MTDERVIPQPRRRRSSLKRQRRALIIALAVVVVLAVAFALVFYFTSRNVFEDADGTKYYILRREGEWIMEDEEGNRLYQDSDGNYITKIGTIIMVEVESGDYHVVSYVSTSDSETLDFDYVNGEYSILMYPRLQAYDETDRDEYRIQSIEIVNEKDSFGFVLNAENKYELKGYPNVKYNSILFSTLVYCTGTPRVLLRLTPEAVALYGYGEYGLPENDADAKNYFTITSMTGATHKVILGNKIPSGAGYYVRYAGRSSVYILNEMTESDYNATFTKSLLSTIEEYVTPRVVVEMTATNYFDVSNFKLYRMADYAPGTNVSEQKPFVTFYYEPIERRRGTFYSNVPYFGEGDWEGFYINTFRVDDCLLSLQEISASSTVWLDSADKPLTLETFAGEYGVAYAVSYYFNSERYGAEQNYDVKTKVEQQVWISPISDHDTYYIYNEMFDMVVEVSREYLEFVEWSRFEWVDADVFSGHIGYLQKIEALIPGGTTAGITGVNRIEFTLDNSASLTGDNATDKAGNVNTAELKAYAKYGSMQNAAVANVTQVRKLYQSLMYSSLAGNSSLSESVQQSLRDGGDASAKLVLRLTYDIGDEVIVREYRFYDADGGRQYFATVNGNGSFYMQSNRVDKLIRDLGRALVTDEAALAENAIDPLARN